VTRSVCEHHRGQDPPQRAPPPAGPRPWP
jgi:hypothetical protein